MSPWNFFSLSPSDELFWLLSLSFSSTESFTAEKTLFKHKFSLFFSTVDVFLLFFACTNYFSGFSCGLISKYYRHSRRFSFLQEFSTTSSEIVEDNLILQAFRQDAFERIFRNLLKFKLRTFSHPLFKQSSAIQQSTASEKFAQKTNNFCVSSFESFLIVHCETPTKAVTWVATAFPTSVLLCGTWPWTSPGMAFVNYFGAFQEKTLNFYVWWRSVELCTKFW